MTEKDIAMAQGKELILGLFAQNVTENVKFRLNLAATVRYIAVTVFQNAKKAARLTQPWITDLAKDTFLENTVPTKDNLEKDKSLIKKRSHFLHVEKSVFKYLGGGCYSLQPLIV